MSSPSGAVIGVLIDARRVLEAAALLLQLNATGTLLPRIFFCHAALPPRCGERRITHFFLSGDL